MKMPPSHTVRERKVAVQEYDEQPPWIRCLPDPDPPTPEMMGAKLREIAPSVHEQVEGLAVEHPVVRKDRRLMSAIMCLFEAIVDGLPADTAVELAPAEEIDLGAAQDAVRLLTRSSRLQTKDARTSFGWPRDEVYEYSDTLLIRAKSTRVSEEVRQAAQAAYRLFVRIALVLAELYEHCWVDRAALRRLRLQRRLAI